MPAGPFCRPCGPSPQPRSLPGSLLPPPRSPCVTLDSLCSLWVRSPLARILFQFLNFGVTDLRTVVTQTFSEANPGSSLHPESRARLNVIAEKVDEQGREQGAARGVLGTGTCFLRHVIADEQEGQLGSQSPPVPTGGGTVRISTSMPASWLCDLGLPPSFSEPLPRMQNGTKSQHRHGTHTCQAPLKGLPSVSSAASGSKCTCCTQTTGLWGGVMRVGW